MSSIYPVERTCAACGKTSRIGTEPRRRLPTWDPDAGGVDGRPGYDDMSLLLEEELIEECASCGHLAPILSVPYPRLEHAIEARSEVLARRDHTPEARRCLAVANLFAGADPREEGRWALRAAWLDEGAGSPKTARSIRLRAGASLEEASREGYALAPARLATSLILAETFRAGGDFERALEHAVRGLRFASSCGTRERAILFYELDCVLERRAATITRADALAGFGTLTPERRSELVRTLESVVGELTPITLLPRRTFRHPSLRTYATLSKEAVVFAQDYMDVELMIPLLREGRTGVWEAIRVRPHFLPALLRASDHPDARVREHALGALYEKTFSFEADQLAGQGDAVSALLRRLGDTDERAVRSAGAIARELLLLEASMAAGAAAAARAALPRWTADLSTTGVLERLIERAESSR